MTRHQLINETRENQKVNHISETEVLPQPLIINDKIAFDSGAVFDVIYNLKLRFIIVVKLYAL